MSEIIFNTGITQARKFYSDCLDLNCSANKALERGKKDFQEAVRLDEPDNELDPHLTFSTRVLRVRGGLDLTLGTHCLWDYLNDRLKQRFNQHAAAEEQNPYLSFPEELGIGMEEGNLRPGAFALDGALRVELKLITFQIDSLLRQARAASFNPENFFDDACRIACHIQALHKPPHQVDYGVDPNLGFGNTTELVSWLETIMKGRVPPLPEGSAQI